MPPPLARWRRSFGGVALATNMALVIVTYIITRPGAAAFAVVVGVAVVATVRSWIRKEAPRWVTWAATVTTVLAPIVAVRLLKSA